MTYFQSYLLIFVNWRILVENLWILPLFVRREVREELLKGFGRLADINLLGADDLLLVLHPFTEILTFSVVIKQLQGILNKWLFYHKIDTFNVIFRDFHLIKLYYRFTGVIYLSIKEADIVVSFISWPKIKYC